MVSVRNEEKLFMNDVYVMQRANGDVFALDDHGRFRVPLFHSKHDGMIARLRNFGMLLFKPVTLDATLLKEIVLEGSAAELEFWLIDDPSISLNRGRLVQPAQLGLLPGSRDKLKNVPEKAVTDKTASLSSSTQSSSKATATWEDEGGLYAKCA